MKRFDTSLATVAVVLFALSAGAAEQPDTAKTSIVLKLDARVNGPYVTIGDIADVSGPDADTVKRLVVVRPSEPIEFITADAVKSRLDMEGRSAEISGAKFCKVACISQNKSSVSLEGATDVLAAELLKAASADMTGAGENTALYVSDVNVWSDTGRVAPADVSKVNIEGSGGNGDTRWVRFTGEDVRGGRVWGWGRFDVRLKGSVVVATAGLSRGQFLSTGDVSLKETAVKPGEKQGFASLSEVVGRRVLRPMSAGEVLKPSDLERPVLVPRGREVTVVVQGAGYRLSDRAVAKDDGALGEVIRVENLRSQDVYRARVTSAETVEPLGKENG